MIKVPWHASVANALGMLASSSGISETSGFILPFDLKPHIRRLHILKASVLHAFRRLGNGMPTSLMPSRPLCEVTSRRRTPLLRPKHVSQAKPTRAHTIIAVLPEATLRPPWAAQGGDCMYGRHLQILLEAVLNDSEADMMKLPILDQHAVSQMHKATNVQPPTGDPAAVCLHQLFEASARSNPSTTCIRAGSTTLTYAEVSRPAQTNVTLCQTCQRWFQSGQSDCKGHDARHRCQSILGTWQRAGSSQQWLQSQPIFNKGDRS